MVEILNGIVVTDDVTKNAMGGTELQAHEMVKRIDGELLSKFQIIHSRQLGELDYSKKRVLVLHDLPADPMNAHIANGGWNRFDQLVFVSNWQMQQFISYFGIPWHKCVVIQNAINPLQLNSDTPKELEKRKTIRMIYHTTPHRGLNILYPVFDALTKTNSDIELDVYSSFKVYGWEERDAQYAELFDACKAHPNINYHGSVSNEEVKEAVSKSDIFAYPSTWPETSCIALIEAMSAGLLCVHPNYAALSETAANWTMMYQFQENANDHANVLYHSLQNAINAIATGSITNRLHNQAQYTNMFYDWNLRALQWEQLLRSLL